MMMAFAWGWGWVGWAGWGVCDCPLCRCAVMGRAAPRRARQGRGLRRQRAWIGTCRPLSLACAPRHTVCTLVHTPSHKSRPRPRAPSCARTSLHNHANAQDARQGPGARRDPVWVRHRGRQGLLAGEGRAWGFGVQGFGVSGLRFERHQIMVPLGGCTCWQGPLRHYQGWATKYSYYTLRTTCKW